MSASHGFETQTRRTRSTAATMDANFPSPSPLPAPTTVANDGDQQAETSLSNLVSTGAAEAGANDEGSAGDDSDGNEDEEGDTSEDSDYGGSADVSPFDAKKRVKDQRRFGGSSKGRKCYRWTPRQEAAAVEGMIAIRAEGEVVGDLCFEELHRRLVAGYPGWNHSVSGIMNAWHRRKLVRKVQREEARAKQEKHRQQEEEDEALGLTHKRKGVLKRETTSALATPRKREQVAEDIDEETDKEAISTGKRRRMLSYGSALRPGSRNTTTDLSYDLSLASLLSPPVSSSRPTVSPAPVPALAVPDFPTVTVGFKRYNNDSRRTRDFTHVNNMQRFWNQVIATPMFENLDAGLMVVTVTINESQKTHYMAKHDEVDYANFLQLVKKAVEASGEKEVVINVEAAC